MKLTRADDDPEEVDRQASALLSPFRGEGHEPLGQILRSGQG